MKAIQITFDEKLLAALDASPEAKRDGRSAVLRRAAAEYLRRVRTDEIREAYAQAYEGGNGLGEEFEGWEDEGEWPPK